jgi:Outer membrane protein beta-barrel family/CarboxypepD_reg-like domain
MFLKHISILITSFLFFKATAQKNKAGTIIGTVIDAQSSKSVNAGVQCILLSDTNMIRNTSTDKLGNFELDSLPYGYYKIKFTSVGYSSKIIDSIHIRMERNNFNLNEILLTTKNNQFEEVVVYAEKPIIENKDGKIIFNVGETAAANSSNANDLLKTTPLVTVDADGNVLLKGKQVKILIDDKPVELNAKQLQDMLESMPGSFIEKIEVMTTPPPQYANERGGVINIVSKKGRAGGTLRANVYYGTRGEFGANITVGYRKNKWSTQLNIGVAKNTFVGNSYSRRTNIYTDSSNYFYTDANNNNRNTRPNLKWNTDYDINKRNSVNLTINYNTNDSKNQSVTEYTNSNQLNTPYKKSDRNVATLTDNNNLAISSSYIWKDQSKTGVIKLITGVSLSQNENFRDFYQQFFDGTKVPTGVDSTQRQENYIKAKNYNVRLNYDKPLDSGRYFLNVGVNYLNNNSDNDLRTLFLKKPELLFVKNTQLSTIFDFHQTIQQVRAAFRYRIQTDFFATIGVQTEFTITQLNHESLNQQFKNKYSSWLPFATITKKYINNTSLTFTYKKSIQRPGITETNPAIEYSDPYNIRFGNPDLLPYYAHNFDFIVGKWNKLFSWNTSVGYNELQNLFAPIRTLQTNGTTFTTYQNISNRKEYEASIWGGYTYAKNSRINMSIGYNYNIYSDFDKKNLRYRDGGSLTSNINGNYNPTDIMQYGMAITYNRFANPQGTVRNNVSMNFTVQRKFLRKTFTATLTAVDPFIQQENRTFTFGNNFNLESYSFTQTRNFKIAIAYNFIKKPKAKGKLQKTKGIKKP